MAGEMLGPILLTIHNLTYYQRLMAGARAAIEAHEFEAFYLSKMRGWGRLGNVDEMPVDPTHSGQRI